MSSENVGVTTHYAFSNILFPALLFKMPDYITQEFCQGKQQFLEYLGLIWDKLKQDTSYNIIDREDDKEVQFEICAERFDNKTILCIVIMPIPKMSTESFCFAFTISEIYSSRYFTYELGFSIKDEKPLAFTGEWIIENDALKHLNYGSDDKVDINIFVDKVKLILNKQEEEK